MGIKLKKRKTESEPEPGDIPLKEAPTDYAVMEAPKKVTEDDHQYGSFHRPESVNLTKTNKTMKKTEKRWEIKYSELQMKGELGRGSFGIVRTLEFSLNFLRSFGEFGEMETLQ